MARRLHPLVPDNALQEWQSENQVSDERLARLIGCTSCIIQYWRQGKGLPSLVNAFKLERITQGAIPAVYWLSTPLGLEAWEHRAEAASRKWANHRARQERVGGRDEADAGASRPTAPVAPGEAEEGQ